MSAVTRPRALRGHHLLLDWIPLVALIAVYEDLRDLVPLFGARRHYIGWIDSDLFGGQLPSTWLQAHFHQASSLDWEDTLATVTYFLYYLVPIAVGLVWWMRSRAVFQRYAAAVLTLCALAFAIYIAMPTIPPWLAYPQSIHEITDLTIARWNLPHQLVAMYLGHDYNLYAAFPSLHAAFPVVLTYYGWLRSRLLGVAMLIYAWLVWISVVFLGEHYVIDIVGGIVCAAVAVVSVEIVHRIRVRRRTSHPVRALATSSP